MIWDGLIGQRAASAFLRAALVAGRSPHAYLFSGPAGVGKRTAGMLLAQVLLCHAPPAPDLACGECRSCRWFATRRGPVCGHPDLLLPLKFDLRGNPTDRLIGDHELLIPLPTMQYLAEQLHRSPLSGPRRVALLPEAQRMCRGQAEGANAFLKTLEEPPASSVVILTSSRPEALLETILSRVQPVHFKRLSREELRQGLAACRAASDEDKELALAMSDGSLGRAQELLGGDLKKWRAALVEVLKDADARACPGLGLTLWRLAEEEGQRLFERDTAGPAGAESADKDESAEADSEVEDEESRKSAAGWKRFVFSRLLELLEAAFRDGLVTASGGSAEQLLTLRGPHAPLAGKLSRQFGARGCERMLETITLCLEAQRLYVRGDLVARVLAGRMVEALQGS